MPTVTITIDRSSMALPDLVIDGQQPLSGDLGLVSYQEPALQPRIKYAPTSDWVHGEMALGFTYQQVMLQLDVTTPNATTEAQARAAIAALAAALGRLSFTTTVTIDGATPETWSCQPGSVSPAEARTYVDLVHHRPVWQVSIPAQPLRSYA